MSQDAPIDVITFGCRLNAAESETMRAAAEAAGLRDVVFVNTCAVTGEAVRQARQTIRRLRRERPGARIIATGCAAQIDPDAFQAMAEVDLVMGNAEKVAPETYRALARDADGAELFSDIFQSDSLAVAVSRERARAFVEIQNGCDHRCTFCTIPFGRGASRSAPAGRVVEAVRALRREGFNEVVLTGVDLTSWGADLPGAPMLGGLVRRILTLVPDLPRLRLSSVDAAEIDPELLRLFAEEERLCPYLHLSLQHGHDLILKRMKRRHSRADALQTIAAVRAVRPDIAFGADLIAGFPTETEEHFAASLSLIDEAGLSFVHVFPFSPRPGTPAARMPQPDRDLVRERAQRLRAAADAALARHLERSGSGQYWALAEPRGRARLADFTPCLLEGEAEPGALVSVRARGHADGLLQVQILSAPAALAARG